MKLSDFQFDLPSELIAQVPSQERTASRLLCLERNSGEIQHRAFGDIIDFLQPDDVLVCNDTQVIPARLLGQKASGGRVQVLVERILDDQRVLAHVRANKSPKVGTLIYVEPALQIQVVDRRADLFELEFSGEKNVWQWLDEIGHVPLPPYIQRQDNIQDKQRYQTVYAKHKGAMAAPTAGLHFDQVLLARLQNKGIQVAYLTLHVGAGTFQPVKVQDISQHTMHREWFTISQHTCKQIQQCRRQGGRAIAVGTTSVRSLESATQSGTLRPFTGETDIFIYPGYQFQCVDALITNFHLSGSSLIMLVAAFAGYENTMQAYKVAIEQHYRFFSYGDAMLIL